MAHKSASPLASFQAWFTGLFGDSFASVDDGKPGAAPRSVEKAARKGGSRAGKARRAKRTAEGGERKPAARKIAHRSGAKMADAAKADTVDPAKKASRARKASKSRR